MSCTCISQPRSHFRVEYAKEENRDSASSKCQFDSHQAREKYEISLFKFWLCRRLYVLPKVPDLHGCTTLASLCVWLWSMTCRRRWLLWPYKERSRAIVRVPHPAAGTAVSPKPGLVRYHLAPMVSFGLSSRKFEHKGMRSVTRREL